MMTKINRFPSWTQSHKLLWGIILVLVFSILRFVETRMWQNWFGTSDFYISFSFILFLLFWFVLMSVGLIVGGIVVLTKTSWRALGWKRERLLKAIGKGVLGFVLIYINVVVWAMLQGNMEPPKMAAPSFGRFLIAAFFAFGLAAWMEENLYRGYLQPVLAGRMRLWVAIVVQAAIFSLAHLGYLRHPLDFGAAFVTGLILGWLRGRDANLAAPYLAHSLFWLLGAFMIVAP